mmetsp:Transcript_80215/g.206487  ORF Transcript_80215/g.206487 Transcript_80215/m.206487 type:complete len:233 (-) Transcript_80215:95-793(-)
MISGKLRNMPRIFDANQGCGSFMWTIARSTVATVVSPDLMMAAEGCSWHSPFRSEVHETSPSPLTVSTAEPDASLTSMSCTLIDCCISLFCGISPKSHLLMWSRNSETPQLISGLLVTLWPLMVTFTLYFRWKSTLSRPVTLYGYAVRVFMEPETDMALVLPSRMIEMFMYGRPSMASVAFSMPAKSPLIRMAGEPMRPISNDLVKIIHSGGVSCVSCRWPLKCESKPVSES